MHVVSCVQPRRLVVGSGALDACAPYLIDEGASRVMIVSGPRTGTLAAPLIAALSSNGVEALLWNEISGEPTIDVFERALIDARAFHADAIVGIGGGSPLDAAKLIAGMLDETRNVRELFGIGTLGPRRARLVLIPTTAGTGSEVSPNSILLDDERQLKLAVISQYLVPDASFIDPALARDLPPAMTAATGIDALTHCIEAYANKRAHPMVDDWALAGIRLISTHLERACRDGHDLAAREALALGSLYGGMCLGPVNTAAVHALAYPLGGEFNVAHGVSNALLLPHVLAFNLSSATERYADVAVAAGISADGSRETVAKRGLEAVEALCRDCNIPMRLSDHGVPADALDRMTDGAMTVQRLLIRNVRDVSWDDARRIYEAAF